MKMKRAVTLLLLAASAAAPNVSRAEQTTPAATQTATRTFALNNIDKARMLFWLNPAPDEKGEGAIELPKGVAELRIAETGNALIARGSNDGLEQLQNVIAFLDQPLQVVELDVHLVFAARGELQKTLQAKSEKLPADTVGAFLIRTRATMDALMLSPGAYVMSGKALTFNNVTAAVPLQKQELTDIKAAKNAPLPPLQIALTPTLNRDGTVTLAAQVKAAPFFELSSLSNLKNDGTIFLQTPVDAKFGAALEAAGARRAGGVVIAITPHVLRKTAALEDK